MKPNMYAFIILLVLGIARDNTNANAQTWRGKHNGLPTGLAAKTVYGDGTNILVGNSSGTTDYQMYYTPDSSTPFNNSPSTLSLYAATESRIAKCMGVLFVGNSAGIFKSDDMGHTWVSPGTDLTNHMAAYSIYAHNDTLYSGSLISAHYSTDTGLTWTTIPGYTGSLPIAFLKTGNTLFIGGTSTLQYTQDFGATWLSVTSPSSISGAAIADIAELGSNVYAASNNGIYQTTDHGHTWARVIAKVFTSMIAVDTSIIGGTSTNGIYQSDNSGTNWTAINNGLPYTGTATYNSIVCLSDNDDYIMCSAGGDSTIYVIGYGELGLHVTTPTTTRVNSLADQGMEAKIYPNPASSETVIAFTNGYLGKITVSLVNVEGRTIMEHTYDNTDKLHLNLAGIPTGTYFMHIKQGVTQATRKITVIK